MTDDYDRLACLQRKIIYLNTPKLSNCITYTHLELNKFLKLAKYTYHSHSLGLFFDSNFQNLNLIHVNPFVSLEIFFYHKLLKGDH